MLTSNNLQSAPAGYVPQVSTRHNEQKKQICQTFKGGRVVFILSKETSSGEAFVDGCCVGTWKDITVGDWSDILYTLSKRYNDIIK